MDARTIGEPRGASAGANETVEDRLIDVLGVHITDVTMARALEILLAMLQNPARTPNAVYFVNASTLNIACEEPSYRALLERGSRVFGDGTGVRWAARMLYDERLRDNVNGTDLTPQLFAAGRDKGLKYFLLGNTPERIERAARFTQDNFPGWTLAGYHHGYVNQDPEKNRQAIEQIRAAAPHLLLVGMGNPLQEQWIDRHLSEIGVPLCMGTGGLFDYWSGDLQRASKWVRAIGYEWLHLLIKQPTKARRYLIGNPLFLARVAQQKRSSS